MRAIILTVFFFLTFLQLTAQVDKRLSEIDNSEIDNKAKHFKFNNPLFKYLADNIIYPTKALKDSIGGIVELKFVIETDGTLSNLEVLQSVGGGCTEEALRLIKSIPHWIPTIANKKPIRVTYSLPIRFRYTKLLVAPPSNN